MNNRKIDGLESALKSAYTQIEPDFDLPSSEWQNNIMREIRSLPRQNTGNEIIFEQFLLKTAWRALGVAAALAVILSLTFYLLFSRQNYSLDTLINNKSIQISYGSFANYDSGGA
jgi:hypothetical protein